MFPGIKDKNDDTHVIRFQVDDPTCGHEDLQIKFKDGEGPRQMSGPFPYSA